MRSVSVRDSKFKGSPSFLDVMDQEDECFSMNRLYLSEQDDFGLVVSCAR